MVYPSSDAEVCNENTSDARVCNTRNNSIIVLLLRSAMRIFNAEVCNKNFSDAKININNTKVNTNNILDA